MTSGTIVALVGLLVAGVGFAAADFRQAEAVAAEAARGYEPAVTYTHPSVPTSVAFLGDSFTAGAGTDESKFKRWTTLVANNRGWLELNYGKGGTNYNTAGPQAGGAAYADRLVDLVRSQPDIVIVSTAGNDVEEKQLPGIEKTFQTLRHELPDAKIIATSPYFRAGDYPAELVELGNDIQREVEEVGGEYLDIGHPLGNHPEAMAEDKAHPNDAGYQLIADAVSNELG